jgi:hypothetical protein
MTCGPIGAIIEYLPLYLSRNVYFTVQYEQIRRQYVAPHNLKLKPAAGRQAHRAIAFCYLCTKFNIFELLRLWWVRDRESMSVRVITYLSLSLQYRYLNCIGCFCSSIAHRIPLPYCFLLKYLILDPTVPSIHPSIPESIYL